VRFLDAPDGDYERDCVMYLRKSKGKAGIDRQRRENQVRAKRLKWRIVAEFEDRDTTAFMHALAEKRVIRDDYLAMLDYLQRDQRRVPLGVLAWHADRIHRDVGEVVKFRRICAQGQHPVETAVSGGYDLTTAMGRKRLTQDALDAEAEVDHMSERHISAKLEAVREGRWLGGPVPFGWRAVYNEKLERRILVLVDEERDAVEWGSQGIFRRDRSLNKIAAEWNRRGLRRKKGGLWDAIEVRRVLLRPRNAALMEHNGKIVRTEREDGKGEWPELIPESLWRAVNQILTNPDRKTTPGPTPRWLGSGLYLCGHITDDGDMCGNKLRVSGNGNGRKDETGKKVHVPAYRCPAKGAGHVSRNAANLDAFVEAHLKAALKRRDVRRRLAQLEPPDMSGKRADLALEEEALAGWMLQAKAPGAIPSLVAAGAAATQQRIDALRAEIDSMTVSPLFAELVAEQDVDALWARKRTDLGWRRAVLTLFLTVVVKKGSQGLPFGWRQGDINFDPSTIDLEWRPLPFDGRQQGRHAR
jgi:site-specific DNA recombinase